jgi:hypothetical protein
VISDPAEIACNDLSAINGRYVVSVFNTSETPSAGGVTGFRLTGAGTIPALADAVAPPAVMTQPVVAPRASRSLSREEAQVLERDGNHGRVMDINRSLFGVVKRNLRRQPSVGLEGTTAMQLAVPMVGDLRSFRINTLTGSCSGYTEISARAVHIGARAVIWEDVVTPLAGTMDAYYAALGQEFDAAMYPTIANNFADPLATDPFTDADGRINMVFSKRVNDLNVGGFVISCDFYERNATTNTGSNFGETFYAVVPLVAGTGYSGDTPDQWLRSIRSTLVHETKHIASFGARLLNPAATSFEASWLEEGTARHSEELWLRNYVYGRAWKSNINYASSIFCDVRPSFTQCAGAPYGITRHYVTLYTFLENPGAYSPFGSVATGDSNYYGSAWSLVRWAIDRYASTEPAFLGGMTQSAATGMANISGRAGAGTTEIMGSWSLAFYLDENAAFASNASMTIPTWNTRDIFSSMSSDLVGFPKSFPLAPVAVGTGDFAVENGGIRGGSFALYDLSGSSPIGRTISLIGPGGVGVAPSSLRIAIARIQ